MAFSFYSLVKRKVYTFINIYLVHSSATSTIPSLDPPTIPISGVVPSRIEHCPIELKQSNPGPARFPTFVAFSPAIFAKRRISPTYVLEHAMPISAVRIAALSPPVSSTTILDQQ
jgi:hypothetical protein